MNAPTYYQWGILFANLAVIGSLAVVTAGMLHRLLRNAQHQRTVWRGVFLCLLVAAVMCGSGGIAGLHGWLDRMLERPAQWEVRLGPVAALETVSPSVLATSEPGPLQAADVPVATPPWPLQRTWLPALLLLAGLSGGLLYFIALRIGLALYLRRHAVPCEEADARRFGAVAQKIGYRGAYRLLQIGGPLGPLVFGVFRPIVLLPTSFLRSASAADQDVVYGHEAAHLLHRDPFWQDLAYGICLFFWWNPLVWWARQQLILSSEFAADSCVVGLDGDRESLAACLVRIGRFRVQASGVPAWLPSGTRFRSQLGRRVRRLLDPRCSVKAMGLGQSWGLSAMLGGVVLAGYVLLSRFTLPLLAQDVGLAGNEPAERPVPIPAEPEVNFPDSEATQNLASEPPVVVEDSSVSINEPDRPAETVSEAPAEVASVESERPQVEETLYTRRYRLDPYNTALALHSLLEVKDAFAAENLQSMFRSWLQEYGLELAEQQGEGLRVFVNHRNGIVFARGTEVELQQIEEALSLISVNPPQLVVRARLVELSTEQLGELAEEHPEFAAFVGTGTEPPQSVVLTEAEVEAVIAIMEGRSGIDVLAAPSVTTLSGRVADVVSQSKQQVLFPLSAEALAEAPAGTDPFVAQEVPVGVTLRMTPHVLMERGEILMEVAFQVVEFLGYDDPGTFAVVGGEGKRSRQTSLPLPRFRDRSAESSMTIRDGQSVVLRGLPAQDIRKYKSKIPFLGDLPVTGRLFRRERTEVEDRTLLVFVTAFQIDPAGNRILPRSEETSEATR